MVEMMELRSLPRTDAVSHVLGEILMIALAVSIAGALFFYCNMSMPDVERPQWVNELYGYSESDGGDDQGGLPAAPFGGDEGGDMAKGGNDLEKDGGDVTPDAPPTVTDVQIVRTNLPDTGYVKDGDDIRITAQISDEDMDTITIIADLSKLLENGVSAVSPDLMEDNLATWILSTNDFTTVDETKTVTIVARDVFNNEGTAESTVFVDNKKPSSVSSFKAAPGHNKISLTWTNPVGDPDLDIYGIVIRRVAWGGYPSYSGSAPSYPNYDTGSIAYQQIGMTTSYIDTFDSQGGERDIHYYQAFIFDKAYNYAPAIGGAQGRATNYWLGDVEPRNDVLGTIGDGYVTQQDVDALSLAYNTVPSSPLWNPHCDVGPTYDWSSKGIPHPDRLIGFEDMMIFAMNMGTVSP